MSTKSNFVSPAVVEDSMYDKISALDFAIQQYHTLFPSEVCTEKEIKVFYDTEVGKKA